MRKKASPKFASHDAGVPTWFPVVGFLTAVWRRGRIVSDFRSEQEDMSGTLFHSKAFTTKEYLARDGQMHFEVVPIDGDSLSLGHVTWQTMLDIAEAHGMPRAAWPEFLPHDFGIDVPLDDICAKQAIFRRHILLLPQSALEQHRWLACVAEWTARGESVFFCGN